MIAPHLMTGCYDPDGKYNPVGKWLDLSIYDPKAYWDDIRATYKISPIHGTDKLNFWLSEMCRRKEYDVINQLIDYMLTLPLEILPDELFHEPGSTDTFMLYMIAIVGLQSGKKQRTDYAPSISEYFSVGNMYSQPIPKYLELIRYVISEVERLQPESPERERRIKWIKVFEERAA